MTIWDNISLFKFKIHKARVVCRFVNSVRKKYINEIENRLTPVAFYRRNHDEKEISVYCIDKYIKNGHRQHKTIWKLGDKTFKRAHDKLALARGDIIVSKLENICYDKDKQLKLYLIPSLFNEHCNVKPYLEDFHEDDIRVAKLADESHLVKRI